MPTGTNKKRALLYVLEVLKNYTDEEHPMTYEQIIQKIEEDYNGVRLERKFIGSCIADLDEVYHCVGGKGSKYGCYYNARLFTKGEIPLLVDMLFSSKTLTGASSEKLATRILSTLSVHQKENYDYISDAQYISRGSNKRLFFNVERICDAIVDKKQISFHYYSSHQAKALKEAYCVSPYALLPNLGRYYLIYQANDKPGKLSTIRLENVDEVKILTADALPIEGVQGYENGFNDAQYINEHPHFKNGRIIKGAVLKLENKNARAIVMDCFGEDTAFEKRGDTLFAHLNNIDEISLKYYCLQYGEYFSLMTPETTKKKIEQALEKIGENYNAIKK